MRLQDNGRRLYGEAQWEIDGVDAGADLVLIARTDHTGGGQYAVEVNGRRVETPLQTPWLPHEWWSEETLIIPRALLLPGPNKLKIIHLPESERDAEFYQMWFLQPPK